MSPFRVVCATCGWYNESRDEPWTRHAGELHVGIFKPGHVLVESEMFAVKLKRTGFETVIAVRAESEAHSIADGLNYQYQTDEYYVEPWKVVRS